MFFMILGQQNYALLFSLVALSGILVTVGGVMHFNLYKPGFDWFESGYLQSYKLKNLTYVRIFEAALGLGSIYAIRNFPANLKIMPEYLAILMAQFMWNWYFELEMRLGNSKSECGLFDLRVEFVGDMLRAIMFSFILSIYTRYEKVYRVPALYITSITDFVQDIQCRYTFRRFLVTKFPKEIESFDELVNLLDQGTSSLFRSGLVPEILEERFSLYMKTKSFRTLKKIIKIADEVEALGFG